MGTLGRSAAKGQRTLKAGGPKKRSATSESHGGSRVEPSKLKQHERDVRAKNAKKQSKK